MRARYDQLAKQMLRDTLEPAGAVEIETEVGPGEAQRIDVWFVPDPAREGARAALGLLGRIAAAPCLLEPFHRPPGEEEMFDCLRKHLNWARLRSDEKAMLWVLSAGRPDAALAALEAAQLVGWPEGVYKTAPLLRTRIVVLSELPRMRDTLLLRLMGAGRVLRGALADLRGLPPDDELWRRQILPILVLLRFESPKEPRSPMHEDEEIIAEARALFDEYMRQAERRGEAKGEAKGEARGRQHGRLDELQRLFARRLGRALTDAESALLIRRFATLGPAVIEDLVLDGTAATLVRWLESSGAA